MRRCGVSTCSACYTCSNSSSGLCELTYCYMDSPPPAYGHVLGNMRTIGNKRRFECNYGPVYSIEVSVIECLTDGQWSERSEMVCLKFGNQLNDAFMDQLYSPSHNITTKTLNECVHQCALQTWECLSVNYHTASGECRFSTKIAFKYNTYYLGFRQDIGWTVVQKIFPVFMTTADNNITYQLNKSMAIQRCIDLGTTIATFDDVRTAYDLGFFACRCGYAAHFLRAFFYMATSGIPGCGSVGINYCSKEISIPYDVYCKATDYV